MLRWALTGADAGKVTTTGNAAHDLSGVYETGKETIARQTDRINNVYDLEGNGREWTAEANGTTRRSLRGGYYGYSYAPSFRNYDPPTYTHDDYCSRPVLYVK